MFGQYKHIVYLCITNLYIYNDMDKKTNEKIPIRPTLRGLEVGGKASFRVEDAESVRNSASVLKQKYHTEYTCNTDPNGITITVTRIA